KFLQETADARVEDHVADLEDDAAEDLPVDLTGKLDLLAGLPLDLLADLLDHSAVELDRAGDRHVEAWVLLLPEVLELTPNEEHERHSVLFDQELEEVDELGLGPVDRPLQAIAFFDRGEMRAEEEDLELAVGFEGVGELREL